MPLDRVGRADEPMLQEMKDRYLGRLIRVDFHNANVGIVTSIKTHREHFGYRSYSGGEPLIMRLTRANDQTQDFYIKPARIEIWGQDGSGA